MIYLTKDQAKLITVLALVDQLLIDVESQLKPKSRAHNAVVAMRSKQSIVDDSIVGKLPDEFIEHSERYLAKVQNALDTFWEEVTTDEQS